MRLWVFSGTVLVGALQPIKKLCYKELILYAVLLM